MELIKINLAEYTRELTIELIVGRSGSFRYQRQEVPLFIGTTRVVPRVNSSLSDYRKGTFLFSKALPSVHKI